jgi:hypothetical protein
MNFKKEWNEYVIGYVLTSDDNRNINVQYEVNRNSNHPEPNVVAVIGAEGDETINAYTYEEQEEIKQYILADEKIQAVAKAMTKIIYSDNYDNNIWVEFYGVMSESDIVDLANEIGE